MKNRWLLAAVALVLLILALVFWPRAPKDTSAPQGTSSAIQESAFPVAIGYLRHPGYLPLFCADHLEYFKEFNVDANLVPFESSPAMMAAFLGGDIDIVPVATATALATQTRDPGRFQVFAISSETKSHYLTSIVTLPPAQSGIESIDDLKGKTVGIFPGPAAATLFGLVFKKFGLSPESDLDIRALGPPLHVQALQSGQVDALATYEPYATQAVLRFGAVKLVPAAVETHVLSPTQGGSWLISTELVEQNPKAAQAVVAAIEKGIDFISGSAVELPEIIAAYTPVEQDVAREIPIVTYAKLGQIDLGAYQRHADLMLENGVISSAVDVSAMLYSAGQPAQ